MVHSLQNFPGPLAARVRSVLDRFEGPAARWLDWIVGGAVLCGLLSRAAIAFRSYLNPDEAWHFLLANASGFEGLWAQSMRSTHPPVLIVLLHLIRKFGTSEPLLRSIPVISGAAAAWLAYRWLSSRGDRADRKSGG